MGWLQRVRARLTAFVAVCVAVWRPAPAGAPGTYGDNTVDIRPQAPADPIDPAMVIALALMRRFEGFFSAPYLCPAGVPTIGWGTTHYEDGRAVKLTDAAISRERADALLLHQVKTEYLPRVLALCPALDTPERLGAILDFGYNLGAGALAGSTLRKKIARRDWAGAKGEIVKWIKGGGKVLRGLVLRRQAEAALL